jgi:hypothetical protein
MGSHIVDGQFQSDKYPTTPRGKVPLSVEDVTAQDLLWEYAQRRRSVDGEFSDDLEHALRSAGYESTSSGMNWRIDFDSMTHLARCGILLAYVEEGDASEISRWFVEISDDGDRFGLIKILDSGTSPGAQEARIAAQDACRRLAMEILVTLRGSR